LRNRLTMTSGCRENPPHDTESAEPCLRTLRPSPIVPKAPDVLAAELPASQEPPRRPVPKTLPSPSARFPRARGSKSEGNISTAHGGCGANFECLRETKDLSAPWPTGAERKGRIRRKRRTLHPAPLARPCYRPVTMAWSLVFAAAAAYGLFQTARGLAYRHGRSPRCRRRRHYASASPGTRAFRRC
jgi:hypothetical protein